MEANLDMDSLSAEENEKIVLKHPEHPVDLNKIITSCQSLSYCESNNFRILLPQIIATVVSGSLHVVVGTSLVYSAILIPQLMDVQNSTDANIIHVTKSDTSWITSCMILVAPVAAIVGGFLMDVMGRLNMVKLTAIPNILGWILIALAINMPMLLTGRVLTGIAAIWGTCPATVYVTEIGRPDVRGSLVAILPFFISIGMVLGYLKGWFMDWRLIAWLCNIYTIIPIILIMFIPESPAWLVSKGRIEQARKSLEWFHKYQPRLEQKFETFAELQLSILQKEHMLKMEEKARMAGNGFIKKAKMFILPTAYKPFLILTGLFVLQQFSGVYVILFYGVTFFKEIGTDINPYLASVFLGIMRLIMTLANTWLMKRYNRRSLLMVSAAGMAICMGVSGLFTKWIHKGTTTNNWVPVAMLMMYFIFTALGLMNIPFTIIAELFPIAIRGISHSIVISIAYLIMFAALHSYYSLTQLFGGSSGIQFFFGAMAFGALVFGFVFLPETHRKKLSDIENYFWHHTTYLSVQSDFEQDKNLNKKYLFSTNNFLNLNHSKLYPS